MEHTSTPVSQHLAKGVMSGNCQSVDVSGDVVRDPYPLSKQLPLLQASNDPTTQIETCTVIAILQFW